MTEEPFELDDGTVADVIKCDACEKGWITPSQYDNGAPYKCPRCEGTTYVYLELEPVEDESED